MERLDARLSVRSGAESQPSSSPQPAPKAQEIKVQSAEIKVERSDAVSKAAESEPEGHISSNEPAKQMIMHAKQIEEKVKETDPAKYIEDKAPDVIQEVRGLKTYLAILEAKLEAQAKLLEAQSRALEAQAKALAAVEARTSEESLTYRIQQLVLSSLQKVGISWGEKMETETPEKSRPMRRGSPVKQALFSTPST